MNKATVREVRSSYQPSHSCRFCGKSDGEDEQGLQLIQYGVRHHAHPDCLLKAKGADAFTLLHDWQLEQFPALAANRAGLLEVLMDKIRSRRERTK